MKKSILFIILSFIFFVAAVPRIYAQQIPKNLLTNSSFELPGNMGWGGWGMGGFEDANFAHGSDCYLGNSCLKLDFTGKEPVDFYLDHKMLPVAPGKTYTISGYVKSTLPQSSGGSIIEMRIVDKNGKWLPENTIELYPHPVDNQWKRFERTATPTTDQIGIILYFSLTNQNYPKVPHSVYLDAFQLEEGGSATPYTYPQTEYNLKTNQPANIYTTTDPLIMTMYAYNPSAQAVPLNGKLQIVGTNQTVVQEQSVTGSLSPSNLTQQTISFTSLPPGFYRGNLYDGANHLASSISFGMVEPAKQIDPSLSAYGTHIKGDRREFPVLQKLGVHWWRALDFTWAFYWDIVQPQIGASWNFTEADALLSRIPSSQLDALGILYAPPLWARQESCKATHYCMFKPELMPQWLEYVRQVVGRYKDRIRYWEVWNEPYGQMNGATYANLLKETYTVIKATCPSCQVVGLISYDNALDQQQRNFVTDFKNAGGLQYLDIISSHFYQSSTYGDTSTDKQPDSDNPAFDLESRMQAYKTQLGSAKPQWMTETSVHNRTVYDLVYKEVDQLSPGYAPYHWMDASRFIARYYTIALANGMQKVFYFFNTYPNSETTFMPNNESFFEYDGAIRPLGIAYAVNQRRLDGLVFDTKEKTADYTMYTFKTTSGDRTRVLWAKQNSTTRTFPIALKKTSLYGETVVIPANTPITITVDPVYLQDIPATAPVCPKKAMGDINCDGVINILDYQTVVASLNLKDNKYTIFDLNSIVANFGK